VAKAPSQYLYTVEVPALSSVDQLLPNPPASWVIVVRGEDKLGVAAPTNVLAHGKLFKEWIGMMLTGAMDVGLEISVRKAFGWRSNK